MLIGALCWLVSSLFLVLAAYLVYPLFRTHRPSLNIVIFVFLLIFLTTATTFLFGMAGQLKPLPVALASLAGMVVCGLLAPTRTRIMEMPKSVMQIIQLVKDAWSSMPRWLQWVAIFFAGVSLVRFVFLSWALPPFVWDSLTYHLTNVAEWTQRGRIELFETSVVRIHNAANYEVLATWFTVFLHHDVIIELAGLPVYFLAFLSIYAIGRTLSFSRTASFVAGLAYASTPALLIATTGTKNDPHMAAYYLAGFVLLLQLRKMDTSQEGANILGLMAVWVLVFFLALGTKAYILHLLPGWLFAAFVGTEGTILRGLKRWGTLLRRGYAEVLGLKNSARLALILILLAGAILGLYWNARNWLLTGNPFYPYGVAVETEQVFEGAGKTIPLSVSRLIENLSSLTDKFGDRAAMIMPDLPETTGWGWIAYGLGLPALVWGCVRKREIRLLTTAFALSFTFLYMSTRPSPWNMRYATWVPAIFVFAVAALWDWIPDTAKALRGGVASLLVFSLGMNLVITLNYGRIPLGQFKRMLELPAIQRDASRLRITVPQEYQDALDLVPVDEKLGYYVHQNGFIYPLYRSDYSQRLTFIPLQDIEGCEQLRLEMTRRGTGWLFLWRAESSRLNLVNSCEATEMLSQRGEGLYELE